MVILVAVRSLLYSEEDLRVDGVINACLPPAVCFPTLHVGKFASLRRNLPAVCVDIWRLQVTDPVTLRVQFQNLIFRDVQHLLPSFD